MAAVVDWVVGLVIGADAYLMNQYGQREFAARIRADPRRGLCGVA